MVDAALLVGRWDSGSADGADAGFLVCAPLSRLLRGQGEALDGAAGSVTNSALSLSGAASCCASLRDAALRCELRTAPRCCDALLGVVGPEWHARAGFPRGGETLLTRSRGGAATGRCGDTHR